MDKKRTMSTRSASASPTSLDRLQRSASVVADLNRSLKLSDSKVATVADKKLQKSKFAD